MRWQVTFGNRAWRRWFAWYPARLQDTDDMVWLEWCEMKVENIQGYLIRRYRQGGTKP